MSFLRLCSSLLTLSCLLAGLSPQVGRAVDAPSWVRDVEYGRAGEVSLRLDACTPPGPGPFPVAILVHGGGWSGGTRTGAEKPGSGADITPWFSTFTEAGFVWFSIDYRLAPAHRWPAQLEDVLTAIRWVKAHAGEYRGDPSRIVIVGHSAGGHLALQAAVVAEADTRVQAAVGYAPVSDLEFDSEVRGGPSSSLQNLFQVTRELTPETRARLRASSPIGHVKPGLPPMLILHGDADRTVPVAMSRRFEEKMLAAGNTCDVVVLPRAPHGLLAWDKLVPTYRAQLTTWLQAKLLP
ncbi:MAG TPA: alpha/beta hydrolase [Opitutaceae bacterium]|jgi:acetyl esterase/lipase|nr:alpha/beta hydrolase [Opitutaceae bacterium]